MTSLIEVTDYLQGYLNVSDFRDYCENGLQVEGKPEVSKIVGGVTACEALLDAAIEKRADAVLVHHGYFWKGESPLIKGMKKRRLKKLLENDLSLLAYHLPLDAHEVVGNNVELARVLDLAISGPLERDSAHSIGLVGHLNEEMSAGELASFIGRRLGRDPIKIAPDSKRIRSVGWCTGAAQSYIDLAAELGVDAFISGEISEQTVHVARETGVAYFAAGHHATERFGIQALGEKLQAQFGIDFEFVDIPNPV